MLISGKTYWMIPVDQGITPAVSAPPSAPTTTTNVPWRYDPNVPIIYFNVPAPTTATTAPTFSPTLATTATTAPTLSPMTVQPTVIVAQPPSTSNPTLAATTLPPDPGYTYNMFGELCPIMPLGSVQCAEAADYVSDQTGNNQQGFTSCLDTADCCMCSEILCGEQGGDECIELRVAGLMAAYGNRNIRVYGGERAFAKAKITCSGLESCARSRIVGNSVMELDCGGRSGCQGSTIYIEDPADQFSIYCRATSSCQDMTVSVNFTSTSCDPIELGEIKCLGANACNGMSLTIENNGCRDVVIKSIECRDGSCDYSSWSFFGRQAITIDTCHLPTGALSVPVGSSGLDRCFSGLQELKCSDIMPCMQQTKTITDPRNDFKLVCLDLLACGGSQFTIQVTAAFKPAPIQTINIVCDGRESCKGTNFTVVNHNRVEIEVNVHCTSLGACNGAMFEGSSNVRFTEVICVAVNQCMGCTVNNLPCTTSTTTTLPAGSVPSVPPPNALSQVAPNQAVPSTVYHNNLVPVV
eukprot:CAMPEP_0202686196 /NCGR_PEP_ID=MMETSP1385-20130828/1998_1 /ASSEMBLY_ACC=CAM_ASM_000861 /TAXON_ID=933848 /ORGANISM="Elphidium margaritaceum" /LENGTH=523 /DNA_ID=CAMNT_0049340725 /DNA_START=246 /DNA_END=1817 /DNA_ORIENTATION=+